MPLGQQQIVPVFDGTEDEATAVNRFIDILVARFGADMRRSVVNTTQIRELLNRNTPSEYQISDLETVESFLPKLNTYHIFLPDIVTFYWGDADQDFTGLDTYSGGAPDTDYSALDTYIGGIDV